MSARQLVTHTYFFAYSGPRLSHVIAEYASPQHPTATPQPWALSVKLLCSDGPLVTQPG